MKVFKFKKKKNEKHRIYYNNPKELKLLLMMMMKIIIITYIMLSRKFIDVYIILTCHVAGQYIINY